MSTTTIERRNGNLILNDENTEIVIATPYRFTSDGYLKIPANSTNRTLVKYANIEKLAEGERYELKQKVEKSVNPGASRVSQKSLIDYMTEADKAAYEAIIARAKAAYEEAHKKPVLTDIQKAELKVQKALEALRKLQEAEA